MRLISKCLNAVWIYETFILADMCLQTTRPTFPPSIHISRVYLSAGDDESVHFLQMTPSHVVVQQCTGGCTQLEPSCLPSRTRTRRIPVLVAKCGITLGQRIFGLVSVGIFYLLPACVVVLVAKCGITLGKCIFGLGIGRTLLLIAC